MKTDKNELSRSANKSMNYRSANIPPIKSSKKKLKIKMPYSRTNTLQDRCKNSITPQKIKLKLSNPKQKERMSTLAINDINKSIAHTFDFKDLKDLQNEASVFSSSTVNDLHGTSLCIFTKHNWIRKIDKKIVLHPYFDYFILLVIVISSITLALENPLNNPNSMLSKNLETINM